MSANVRIAPQTYDKLRVLAREAGTTMPQVLDEAIDELYRKRFLDACNAAYARIKKDKQAWQRELKERAAWDATLADGLEDS
jgi:23S rRNA pseudoU1915 N3-methylase RlmH